MDTSESREQHESLQIAIIGMAGRFPGATTLDQFWRNLRDGVESIARLSDAELLAAGVDPAELRDPSYVKAAPILEHIEDFDAPFFGYTSREAEIMDPQQRIFLECAWEALEHAGYNPETYPDSIGVYAGSRTNSYLYNIVSNRELFKSVGIFQISVGNDLANLATRISYKLNLKGPSYGVHTACSTSLVAIHLACQSLMLDECQIALAGGVAINVPHKTGYLYQQGGILAPDGHCRPFDADAAGTIFGSGAGVVVLKRLQDALADGDTIHAVIRGSATNNDGSGKASFTAPSVEGQMEVILDAMAEAQVRPETISYVEAHGTGTALGDPIEIRALTRAFRAGTTKTQFCAIGSVKSNVGHLDAAAGMSSLFKTVLALQHRQLPPSLNFSAPNSKIDFSKTPFYVNTTLCDWTTNNGPRRAGVSSFGFGGTNAHLIVEEAPVPELPDPSRPWQLLVLSARSRAALDAATANLAAHLRQQPSIDLADVAYTLHLGRKAFTHRRIVVARDVADALTVLDPLDPQRVFDEMQERNQRPTAFLFPGQGTQYVAMGRDLYESESVFRDAVDQCCELLMPMLGIDLRDVLYPAADAAETASAQLTQTALAQPALFVIEYALAELWQSWGITPAALLGHSIGEYVAATLAGVFTLEEALRLVATRGRLMQSCPPGAMLAVPLPEAELLPLLGVELSLAAVNGPAQCVVSGSQPAIEALVVTLQTRQVQHRRLHTSHAFHSAMLDSIVAPFISEVRSVTLSPPTIPFVSNVTGTWITAEQATDPAYWGQHLRQPVRFNDGLHTLLNNADRVLLEVGPGTTLSTFARQQPAAPTALPSLRHPQDQRSDLAFLLQTLGRLWLAHVEVDWTTLYSDEERRRIPLPTYPFERERHWIEAQSAPPAIASEPEQLIKKPDIAEWFYRPVWQRMPLPETSAVSISGVWLIVADEDRVTQHLAERLEQLGRPVVLVTPGDAFNRVAARSYQIDLRAPKDYDALLADLRQHNLLPDVIVHSCAVHSDTTTTLAHGWWSLLHLAQAFGRLNHSAPLQLAVLSRQMQPVTGDELLDPLQATLLGPCQVISKEYPNITCRSIDIDLDTAPDTQAELLLGELSTPPSPAQIAYRAGERWTQSYASLQLDQAVAAQSRLRERGVYLITGGLGGIGLVLAEYLAQTQQARLALTGRSTLPERAHWDEWQAGHAADDPTTKKLRQLQALEAHGAEVLVLSADVADESQMRAAVTQVLAHFGALHGVIHAAGVAGGGVIQLKTVEQAARVLAPKVQGARVLDAVTADLPLDFMLFCSSIGTVLGELGQVDYVAANAFIDRLAEQRTRTYAYPTIAIGWDDWQEVGLAVNTAVPESLKAWRAALLRQGIASAEGVEIFARVMRHALPRVIVSTRDLDERMAQLTGAAGEAHLPSFALARPASGSARPVVIDGGNLSRAALERRLLGVWQRVLGLSAVGLHDNFFDLGGDSLSAMQLLAELKSELGIEMPPVALFEAPTVSALTTYLQPEADQAETYQRTATERSDETAIAIIGMAARFPGAPDLATFWRNLHEGVESIRFFDDDELRAAGIPPELLADPRYVKARPILEDVAAFDAALFGYTPREAELMDPQHRVLMELAWAALEDAGYAADTARGAVGVYAGSSMSTYLLNLYADPAFASSVDPLQAVIGNDKDALTTSISYKLNLKGPSLAVQTFCSTSLVAVHLACQSLLHGECDLALAGGVSIFVPQQSGYHYQSESIVSPDGHCRPFDADAQGTLFGNGAGLVVLKRLDQALRDGDTIQAVVRGTAINNDGSLKVGYTAPSVEGQAAVISAALAAAQVDPATIGYVEAHGTGTALGDPIEVTALSKAYRQWTDRTQFCALGSVKGNIGHLDRAAGVAALIKTVLALKHAQLPPSLNFTRPNPKIDFASSPFYVNTELHDWPSSETPRRAGVSSLGFGGTNAHVIIEEAPLRPASDPARSWQLLPLAARTEVALQGMTADLATYLRQHPDANLADVAYTLQLGRKALSHRRIVVARDVADALQLLEAADPRQVLSDEARQSTTSVAFVFASPDAPLIDIGRELYEDEPSFRAAIDRCAALLLPQLDLNLSTLLYPTAVEHAQAAERLQQPELAQPALFAIEYALAQLWQSWGVTPAALLGHSSIGEYVAATVAGVLTLEDALRLVATRARLVQSVTQDELRERLAAEIAQISLSPPQIPLISTASGTWLTTAEETSPAFWLRQSDQPDHMDQALHTLAETAALLEMSPGCTLVDQVRQADSATGYPAIATLPLQEQQSARAALLRALGRLWLAGLSIDWGALHTSARRQRIPLPTYPFERQRYWLTSGQIDESQPRAASALPIADWFQRPSWKRTGLAQSTPQLADYRYSWLILSDNIGLGEALRDWLVQADRDVVIVQVGEQFAQIDEDVYMLDPRRPEDYHALVAALRDNERQPGDIIHLWSIGQDDQPELGADSLAQARVLGSDSLLLLAQALGQRHDVQMPQLWVVSHELHEVTGDETLSPASATLLGTCAGLQHHYPQLVCRSIDVTLSRASYHKAVAQIMGEIGMESPQRLVAYRGSYRWEPTVEAIADVRAVPLTERGNYLITDGLGEIGYPFAAYLADNTRARLVLTDPIALPPRSEWPQWLAENTRPASKHTALIDRQRAQVEATHALPLRLADEQAALEQRYLSHERDASIQPLPADLEAGFDRLCAAYLYSYLHDSGIDTQPGRCYVRTALRTALRIVPKFYRFYDFILSVLHDDGIIVADSDQISFNAVTAELLDAALLARTLEQQYPESRQGFALLRHCVSAYRQVLSGELDALTVLYPNDSPELLSAIEDTRLRYSNISICRNLLADAAARLVTPSSRQPLRILEVGAGTGTMTWQILDQLGDRPVEYTFTDINKLLLMQASNQAQATGRRELRFGLLDLSSDPLTQGYAAHSFDLIVAAEVIHATPNIAATLDHVRTLLVPHGVLLILEATKTQRWASMVWGLADEWWQLTDAEQRHPHAPLLSRARWQDALHSFEHVAIYPATKQDDDYALLIAQQPLQPNLASYDRWLNAMIDTSMQRIRYKLAQVQQLERLGAEVVLLEAASDEATQATHATRAVADFGMLHGVVHCVPHAEVTAVADGLSALNHLLSDQPIDLKLLVSTTHIWHAAVEPAAAAAQRYLDSYATSSHAGDQPWSSVHWLIDPSSANAEVVGHLLSLRSIAQIVVSAQPIADSWNHLVAGMAEQAATTSSGRTRYPRPSLQTVYVAPRDTTEQTIATLWEDVLGIAGLGIYDSFLDLGGDSLQATQLISRLREAFQIELPLSTFFAAPTIAGLAQALTELSGAQQEQAMQEVYEMLAQLSPEEVAAELQRKRALMDER